MSYKFNAICLKFSSLMLFLLLFQTLAAQNLSELGDIADQKQKQMKTDVVLMVANKDTIVYTKDSKLFTALRGQAPIAASSEWLTAALVLALVDEGKITLDDKVSRYIPIFSKYAKNYITLRHCLSHFTGIQSEAVGIKKMLDKKKFESLEEMVNELAKKEIQTNPGEEFRYSNIGLTIAGRVLEIVSKKKFDILAQQKLFRPMGMRQTSFSSLDGGLVDPDEGARSSVLNKGVYKGQRILSEASVQELRKLQIGSQPVKNVPNETTGSQYTLGAWAPENDGKQATVLMAPSLGGTLPVIDFCRGYAFILLYKDLSADQKANAYTDIKGVLDEKFTSNCK
jgi:CubicO group peptidase (beta-lactamase class C family)